MSTSSVAGAAVLEIMFHKEHVVCMLSRSKNTIAAKIVIGAPPQSGPRGP